ncbi:NfeD family protein [Alicyclobacillaceae bacterium I2511]|nr:NfeD family protein [Alicyclobacillaceae bacterium I2511]
MINKLAESRLATWVRYRSNLAWDKVFVLQKALARQEKFESVVSLLQENIDVESPREEAGRVIWWVWFFIALLIGTLEVMSVTFVLLWIAIGALLTAVFAVFFRDIWLQLVMFTFFSAGLLVVTRPLARRWRGQKTFPDRHDALLGQTGVVVRSGQASDLGTVRIHGELWSAVANEPLHSGQTVRVVSATATVLTVASVEEPGPQAPPPEWS